MNQTIKTQRCAVGAAVSIFLVASGCATSPQSQFYALSSLTVPEPAAPASEQATVVAVGPVTIPDYVDRPEIVTMEGPNKVAIHDFDRWAGPLDSDLIRVIVEDLAASLPVGQFHVIQWNPSININLTASHRVLVAVNRFDAAPGSGGAAVFEADWVLYGLNNSVLAIRKSYRKVPLTGTDVQAVTAAMSQCVSEFSKEVAEAIAAAKTANPKPEDNPQKAEE
jgi:uncharacterized lipoprotein YmbA